MEMVDEQHPPLVGLGITARSDPQRDEGREKNEIEDRHHEKAAGVDPGGRGLARDAGGQGADHDHQSRGHGPRDPQLPMQVDPSRGDQPDLRDEEEDPGVEQQPAHVDERRQRQRRRRKGRRVVERP